jgi:hypothetical protein
VYDIETKGKAFDDLGRPASRQARARPVLDDLFDWLAAQQGQVLPKSPMGVAARYALGNRAALARFTEAARTLRRCPALAKRGLGHRAPWGGG